MLQTDKLISLLHNSLLSSGFYDLDEDAGANEWIFAEWNYRLLSALQADFKQHAQVDLQFFDAFFDLFGDRGETVWGVRATTVVDEIEHGISFWVKCIIGLQQTKAYLTEEGQRLDKYYGDDKQLRLLFKRFKKVQQDVYESTILLSELLGVE